VQLAESKDIYLKIIKMPWLSGGFVWHRIGPSRATP